MKSINFSKKIVILIKIAKSRFHVQKAVFTWLNSISLRETHFHNLRIAQLFVEFLGQQGNPFAIKNNGKKFSFKKFPFKTFPLKKFPLKKFPLKIFPLKKFPLKKIIIY